MLGQRQLAMREQRGGQGVTGSEGLDRQLTGFLFFENIIWSVGSYVHLRDCFLQYLQKKVRIWQLSIGKISRK